MHTTRIAVVGAGPAGLTAALALARAGLRPTVFERAPDFRRVGGGILLHSNGQRVLEALGLLDGFLPRLCLAARARLESPPGRVRSRVDYDRLPVPHNRPALVLRHELQEHLLDAARHAGIQLSFGTRCAGARLQGETALLAFDGGREVAFDVIVACDGLHSAIRESLSLPARRRVAREAYLRGVAPVQLRGEPAIRELWQRDGRRFGLGPLADGRTYFYCTAPLGGWAEVRDRGLEGWVDGWRDFGEEVVGVLERAEWEGVSYDELREVELARWSRPPVFLAGDAAHAMTPNLGQGANSAMVDALVLARLLAHALREGEAMESVARRYEAVRRRFVTRVQRASRQMGTLAALRSPPARAARDALLAVSGRIGPLRRRMLLLGAGWNPVEEEYLALAPPGMSS